MLHLRSHLAVAIFAVGSGSVGVNRLPIKNGGK
jgi:hypothetical protein